MLNWGDLDYDSVARQAAETVLGSDDLGEHLSTVMKLATVAAASMRQGKRTHLTAIGKNPTADQTALLNQLRREEAIEATRKRANAAIRYIATAMSVREATESKNGSHSTGSNRYSHQI